MKRVEKRKRLLSLQLCITVTIFSLFGLFSCNNGIVNDLPENEFSNRSVLNSDYSSSIRESADKVEFTFITNVNSVRVDVHYNKNGGSQMNHLMTHISGSTWLQSTTEFNVTNGDIITYFFTYEKKGLTYKSSEASYTMGSPDPTDPVTVNTVSIVSAGSEDICFSLTVESQKEQVHLFARKNGIQDHIVIDLQNTGEIQNENGTYTYSSTKLDNYSEGDLVEARFYTYSQTGGQEFYPGPGDGTFTSITYGNDFGNDLGNDDSVSISGHQLSVNGKPFYMRGVCWNPVGLGGTHPENLDFAGFAAQDAALMQEAGINVIRTYEAITDTAVLDELYAHGIYVINTVYVWGGAEPSATVAAKVNAVKNHPAVLLWSLGNEWNYNGLYVNLSFEDSMAKINEAAAIIKANDPTRPIATVYGHIPSKATVDAMPNIDVWGLNMYSGLSFNNVFAQWPSISSKPMFMAEYGADAWNATVPKEDTVAQAEATRVLTQMLIDNSSETDSKNVCIGGTIFEWADEWWKDGAGSPDIHDVGGIAPGGGPYPDITFNEEYWGIVDIYRNPRPAYYELQKLFK